MSKKLKKSKKPAEPEAAEQYSLWTITVENWRTPFAEDDLTRDFRNEVRQSPPRVEEDDDQLSPFSTPVTYEALTAPTESEDSC
jgi:hypothetical protein